MSDTEEEVITKEKYSTYEQYLYIKDAYVSGDVDNAIELLGIFIDLYGEEVIPLIVNTPPVDTYKTKLVYASIIPEIGIYINSYSIYFKDALWLVIHFKSTSGATNDFSMIYTSNRMYVTGPFKTREYIIHNTPYVVNRPNQPLYIIMSDWRVRVTYENRYREVLYNSDFEFYARYEYKVSELQLMTMLNNKK